MKKENFELYIKIPRSTIQVFSSSLLKTLEEEEKLLVTSNFSFSPCVFYPFGELYMKIRIVVCKLFQFGKVKILLFGKELTLYSTDTRFDASTTDSFRKHCAKRRNCS